MSSENAGGPTTVTTPENTDGGLRIQADRTANLEGYGPTIETLITTEALEVYDSGSIFFLDLDGGFTVTLPTLAQVLASNSGSWYAKFIVKTSASSDYIITEDTGADTDKLIGSSDSNQITTSTNMDYSAAFTQVNFIGSSAVVGDWCDFSSDGVNWYIHGHANVRAGITLT